MPLSVIEMPSGKIRLVPRQEYGSKFKIISLLFQNFTKREKAARPFLKADNHIEGFE